MTFPPSHMWVLIDLANGDAGYKHGAHNYLWWFYTRKAAREHLQHHKDNPKYVDLAGPFKYLLRIQPKVAI